MKFVICDVFILVAVEDAIKLPIILERARGLSFEKVRFFDFFRGETRKKLEGLITWSRDYVIKLDLA